MDGFLAFLGTIDKIYVYFILFISCYAENIFPPFPGDTVVVIGIYFATIGFLHFGLTYIVVCIGSILGFMTFFYIGLLFNKKIIEKRKKDTNFYKKIERVEKWFNKYGYKVILINRFLAGARSLVALTAGISDMNTRKVLLLASLSVFVWNGILMFCGYLLGENWNILIEYIKKYNFVVLGIVITLILVYFLFRNRERGKWFV